MAEHRENLALTPLPYVTVKLSFQCLVQTNASVPISIHGTTILKATVVTCPVLLKKQSSAQRHRWRATLERCPDLPYNGVNQTLKQQFARTCQPAYTRRLYIHIKYKNRSTFPFARVHAHPPVRYNNSSLYSLPGAAPRCFREIRSGGRKKQRQMSISLRNGPAPGLVGFARNDVGRFDMTFVSDSRAG
ncbi:hypothetical protein EVAR_92180_1 [Eumeta japonica]|uniref:Uncharacterized protein n=1 Tax=Eumeta variegata TaxID=151549 RepID=A0A4C2AA98_EUMVA|nr:hypothetical protein EVAR_92180_1 [Eumeta japonica]